MRLSRRALVGSLAAAPLALSACARRSGSRLEMWAMGAEAEHLGALLAALPRHGLPPVRVQPLPTVVDSTEMLSPLLRTVTVPAVPTWYWIVRVASDVGVVESVMLTVGAAALAVAVAF